MSYQRILCVVREPSPLNGYVLVGSLDRVKGVQHNECLPCAMTDFSHPRCCTWISLYKPDLASKRHDFVLQTANYKSVEFSYNVAYLTRVLIRGFESIFSNSERQQRCLYLHLPQVGVLRQGMWRTGDYQPQTLTHGRFGRVVKWMREAATVMSITYAILSKLLQHWKACDSHVFMIMFECSWMPFLPPHYSPPCENTGRWWHLGRAAVAISLLNDSWKTLLVSQKRSTQKWLFRICIFGSFCLRIRAWLLSLKLSKFQNFSSCTICSLIERFSDVSSLWWLTTLLLKIPPNFLPDCFKDIEASALLFSTMLRAAPWCGDGQINKTGAAPPLRRRSRQKTFVYTQEARAHF